LGVAWIEFGASAEASEEFKFNFYLLGDPSKCACGMHHRSLSFLLTKVPVAEQCNVSFFL
jgi:hypothetical protein